MSGKPLLLPVGPAPLAVRLVGRIADWALIAIGAAMAALVFVNVCLRVFHLDLAWVIELGELLMVWVTFLGGACAAQRGMHMSINEFVDKLDAAGRRWADAGVLLFSLAVLAVLSWYGWSLVNANWENELTVLGWPMAVQYMGMALGCSLATFFVAFDLLQTLRGVPRQQRYAAAH